MDPNTNDEAAAAAAAEAAAAEAAAAAKAGEEGSAFAAAAGEPKPLPERIPEKYRVTKDDGTFDIEASTAKLLDGHAELQKRFGEGDVRPKDADSYDPKPEKLDLDALKDDPDYKSWLKGAHAKGLTNAQVSFVLDSFADRLGGQAAVAQAGMGLDEFKAAVEPSFAEYGGFDAGVKLGIRAVRAVIPDVTAEELASLPNNPVMARVLAHFGKEVGEDAPVHEGVANVADWESQVAEIQASEAYNKADHPEHQKAVDKLQALYNARYTRKR